MTRSQRVLLMVPTVVSAAISFTALSVPSINALLFGHVLGALWALLAAAAALVWFAWAANVRVNAVRGADVQDGGSSGWLGRMALLTPVAMVAAAGALIGIGMAVDGSLWRGGVLFAVCYCGPMMLALRLLPAAT